MNDWKEYIQYFKDMLNTLAGKLTAILAFAVLVIFVLGLLGASIPAEFHLLVYIAVIGAMLISAFLAVLQVAEQRRQEEPARPAQRMEHTVPPEPNREEPKPPAPECSPEVARSAYLESVIADSRPLRLVGLDEHAGDPTTVRLSLEDIYVALNTRTPAEEKEKPGRKKTKQEEFSAQPKRVEKSRPLSALEALAGAPDRRMVLLGFPGTGKSTFVRYLSLRMAQELAGAPRKLEGWQGSAVLPLAISLGRFAETLPAGVKQGSAALIEEFLKNNLAADERCPDFARHILMALEKDGGLVLFDGLDEVADLRQRPLVVQAVEAFTDKYARNPNSRFLVTCRTYSYQDPRWQLTKWPLHELALLDQGQIEQFVQAWYEQHTQLDATRADEYAEKRGKLLEALRPGDRRRLYEVAPFPIILTIMAIVHASYELPDSRAQVYQQCVELLLEKWQTRRSIQGRTQTRSLLADLGIPATRLYQALYEIAYEAHRGRDDGSGSLVTEKLVAGVMQDHLGDPDKLKVFLDHCQSANGLLMLQGTVTPSGADPDAPPRRVYTFPHLTFEEYLAGRHLEMLGPDHIRALLDEAHDRWREVVLLLAEYLCFERADRDRMNGLLEALSMPSAKETTDKDWRAIWLAGELLLLFRRAIPKASPHEERILQGLRRLVAAGALTPRERAEAADALDQLGYHPDDLHVFVPVPEPKKPDFLIARYPVTNAQYARFLKPGNFQDKSPWCGFPIYDEDSQPLKKDWGDEGWKWLQREIKDKDNLVENGILYPRDWRDQHFGDMRPSAPVVAISWYEANAYCKWLLSHWEELEEGRQGIAKPALIRLPTRAEWVAAAGGQEPGERFPWDEVGKAGTKKKDEKETIAGVVQRANVHESGIGRTTPVWMYPQGESKPHGLMDLGGNVWEWQADYEDKDRGFLRLSGGAWFDYWFFARVSDWNYGDPSYRSSRFGFRVFVLPS